MNHFNSAMHWKPAAARGPRRVPGRDGGHDDAIARGDRGDRTIALAGRTQLYLCRALGAGRVDEALAAGRQAESIFTSSSASIPIISTTPFN